MAKFNIDARLHRKDGKTHTITVWTRMYARIETAIRRCTEYLIIEGEVGDVIEFCLRKNGYQVGTIRMSATGRMIVVWNDRKFLKVKNTGKTEVVDT